MSAPLLSHLFEPFQQEAQDIARREGGLGLGLALVKGIVELHHGEVAAYSDGPGKGSEFTVRLPLTSAPPVAEPPAARPKTPARRVLVVEDSADAAMVLQDVLELLGHEVAIAHDGAEALGRLSDFSPDIVLCDIGLPGMSGYEVARAIREKPAHRAVTLIAMTGYGQPEDKAQAAEAGFDEHLVKPVDVDTLERVLTPEGRGAG